MGIVELSATNQGVQKQMSTAPSTKKSSTVQNIVAVTIVGFGIMVSSFGFAQASESTVAPTPASVTTPVHVSTSTAVGGVLGK